MATPAVAVKLVPDVKSVTVQQAKRERASSNPFEHLQNRKGGQGLGYVVPLDDTAAAIRAVANEVRHIGRPRRSKSGKRHDAARLNLYINSKLCKASRSAAHSLATTAASIANSYGTHTLDVEKNKKYIKHENEKRFLFDFCYNCIPTGCDLDRFAAGLRFRTPVAKRMKEMGFRDLAYVGRISPELLRLMVMYRVCLNKDKFTSEGDNPPFQPPKDCPILCDPVASEIRREVQIFGAKVLRVVRARVLSTDPVVRGDTIDENSIDAEIRELYGE